MQCYAQTASMILNGELDSAQNIGEFLFVAEEMTRSHGREMKPSRRQTKMMIEPLLE
jgi:hypothetical protein